MSALPVAFSRPPLVNHVQMLLAPTGPAAPPDASAPGPARAPRPVRPAVFLERPALSEPLRRRMADYELEAACSYAKVPDLPSMHHRLASACHDLEQLEDPDPQIEAAHFRLIMILSDRAADAAEEGDAERVQELVDEMLTLGKGCRKPPLDADAAAKVLVKAHRCAFERAAAAARYSAEFGDACQLGLKLAEAASHPGEWDLSDEDRALLFAVCVRRLADDTTSLLARMPRKSFIDSQMNAVRALAAELRQPVPAALETVATLAAQMESLDALLDDVDAMEDLEDADGIEGIDGNVAPPAIVVPPPTVPGRPGLDVQSDSQARLND